MQLSLFLNDLQSNPYFGAGFGLFSIGAFVALSKKILQVSSVFFKRYYTITLEIPCKDRSYEWLLQWIVKIGANHTQHLSVQTKFYQISSGKILTDYNFIPSVGVHFVRYEGSWMKIERSREKHALDIQAGLPWESLTLTCLGRKRQIFFKILNDARYFALKQNEGKTVTYMAVGSEWRQFGHPKRKRPNNSVVLDEGIKERLYKDVQDFTLNNEWYHKRGYLLHGPPGCGKTSYIISLAGQLDYSICILNLSERYLTDDRLFHLLSIAPQQSIILLEDIDAALPSRQEKGAKIQSHYKYTNILGHVAHEGTSHITFSGLLNSLDGVASTEDHDQVCFRLDPALIRPGRIDVKEYIGFCSPYQLRFMFHNFYPETSSIQVEKFVTAVQKLNHSISPAAVQGLLMLYKNNPQKSIENVSLLLK